MTVGRSRSAHLSRILLPVAIIIIIIRTARSTQHAKYSQYTHKLMYIYIYNILWLSLVRDPRTRVKQPLPPSVPPLQRCGTSCTIRLAVLLSRVSDVPPDLWGGGKDEGQSDAPYICIYAYAQNECVYYYYYYYYFMLHTDGYIYIYIYT